MLIHLLASLRRCVFGVGLDSARHLLEMPMDRPQGGGGEYDEGTGSGFGPTKVGLGSGRVA